MVEKLSMANRNTAGQALPQSFVQRVAAGFRYALAGQAPGEWFGPSDPIEPALTLQEAQAAGVAGRQLDYRTGYNIDTRPRSEEAIGFTELRALADNYDLLRLVIETRKDQVCSLPWAIQPRDKEKKADARCEKVEAFLAMPDKEHGWGDWLRMLLEDLFVIDAPAIYIRRTVGGELYALEAIDGATIKRVIDNTGRTPMEGPAYQQVLKGFPAVDYTLEELIYRPRNPRTSKVYGFSQVEQIVNTVNIALRRQMFTLNYFTEGTVPDAFAGCPDDWTPTQISEMQTAFDLMMEDKSRLRKVTFMPGQLAKGLVMTKQPPLKDMFDEWLARVVCYCFSIDPTPFVAQVNRSVAETTREQSLSEGLASTKAWVKSVIDTALIKCFGFEDLEFVWKEGPIVDPMQRAEMLKLFVDAKIMHPDEARSQLGLDPLTPEQKADLTPPPPPMLGGPVAEEEPGQETPGEPKPPAEPKPEQKAKA
jgi:Phage portal protein